MAEFKLGKIFSYLADQLEPPYSTFTHDPVMADEMHRINLQRVRIFSFLIAGLNIFSVLLDYYYLGLDDGVNGFAKENLLLLHGLVSALFILLGVISAGLSKKMIHLQRFSRIMVWIFTTASILMGILSAAFEQNPGATGSIYLMALCGLLIIFYRSKTESLIVLAAGNLAFVAAALYFRDHLIGYASQLINLFIFSVIFFLISRTFYKAKAREIKNIKQIKDQEHLIENKDSQLKNVESALSSINKNILQGLFRIDAHGRLVYVNDFLVKLFGYQSESEMISEWDLHKIIPPNRLSEIKELIERDGFVKDLEIKHVRKDGSVLWGLINCSVSKDTEAVYYDGSITDNTERKNNEKALENLSLVASKTDNAVFIIDKNEKIEWVNEGFTRITGYSFKEAVGKKPGILFQGDNTDPNTIRTLGEKISRGEGFTGELLNYRKDGSEFWALFTLNPILNNKNQIIKYVAVESDITERKKVEKELIKAKEQAEMSMKAKDQFLSMVSHELRTPLNAVIGMTHLLIQENPREDQLPNLKMLKNSGEYLLSLINDILDFSKIEAGKIYIDHTVFNFRELIQTLENTFYYQAQEKNIQFFTDLDAKIPEYLAGDPVRINQILVNLVGNSIKFTDSGFVKLSILPINRRGNKINLQFIVTDTGIGIPKEKLETIFERFEQVGNRSKRGGTGLGLAITKSLVELMSGSISVESELGEGSEFTFDLKLEIGDAAHYEHEAADAASKKDDFSALKILLVEDNKINQLVAAKFLNQWNVSFDVAENGIQAIEMAKKKTYNIILMDLQMPEIDGITAASEIRKLKKYQTTPIVALTAASLEAKEEVYNAGMNDFLIKPFNPVELYNKIKKHSAAAPVKTFKSPPVERSIDLDLSGMQRISDGDSRFLLELMNLCVDQFKTLPAQLKEALKDQDLDEARNIIHKINPSIKMLQYYQLEKATLEFHKLLKSKKHKKEEIEEKAAALIEVISKMESLLKQKAKDLTNKLTA